MMEKPKTVTDPGRVDVLAKQIRDGALSPVELVQHYLDRIETVEPQVEAWRELCADAALEEATIQETEIRSGTIRGPLHGIPVGVKDIIDVAGVPTRCNSKSRADAAPATADAEVVTALRVAGAIILGKTHTTEFAFRDISPARNPYNLDHTPGGSSSGSGAAVSAGMVPVALGTQTMASVNRPAAYCGIAAFKPSTRLMPGGGVAPLSYLYDTVGFYGWSVADAATVFEAICPSHARMHRIAATDSALNITVLQDPFIENANSDIHKSIDQTEASLKEADYNVVRQDAPIDIAALQELHRLTMEYDIGHTQKGLLDEPEGSVGSFLCEAIRRGLETSVGEYAEGRRAIDIARHTFFNHFPETDAFIWPATPKTAPKGLEWTGDASYISPWTALGGPVVTMPVGLSSEKMPIGCLVAGTPGSDYRFASMARKIADAAETH
ncbi:MAG: amidase [Alphaproteobacteria bacterium]|nr:amidase [Alphaproteobacteria bacterium]